MSVNESAIGAPTGLLYRCGIAYPRKRQEQILRTHMLGSHNYSPTLIVVIALESLLFIGIGLWRFSREEF